MKDIHILIADVFDRILMGYLCDEIPKIAIYE